MIDVSTAVVAPPLRSMATPSRGSADDFAAKLKAATPAPEAVDEAPADRETKAAPVATPAPADTTPYADLVLLDLTGKRQRLAGDGKSLPTDTDTADQDASKDLIWSPVAMITPLPVPVTPIALPASGGAIAPPLDGAAPAPLNATLAQIEAQPGAPIAVSPAAADLAPASAGDAATAPVSKDALAAAAAATDTVKADLPIRAENVAPAAPQSQAVAAPPVTLPAGQAFAAAIAAAHAQRDERQPDDTRTPLAIASAALERVHQPAVAAAADAQHGALDLTQDKGLQGMIDHIETLRDDANANDTRIRLVPDALGAVDVAVRKDGDRVHVHFTAENAASARLLSDAQPRLAELADARGVKLGQSSVDSGAGNARQQPSQKILPTAPVAVSGAAASEITDTRIA